jgi:histo-blood group ABO system transferase
MNLKQFFLFIPCLLSFTLSSGHEHLSGERYKIGLCIVATGKYIQFVQQLIESADLYFLPNHDVTYFVFTDGEPESHKNMIKIPHKKLGWPYDTMMRLEAYHRAAEQLAEMDYLFALDADMRFVDTVGDEILGERVGTLHPGFFNKPRAHFTYESKNLDSTAYIRPDEGKHYFAGGFWGGNRTEFLELCRVCVENIYTDLATAFIAEWHDESHLNRYFIDHNPTVILSPSYCYPETQTLRPDCPKKLLALNKNHTAMRK